MTVWLVNKESRKVVAASAHVLYAIVKHDNTRLEMANAQSAIDLTDDPSNVSHIRLSPAKPAIVFFLNDHAEVSYTYIAASSTGFADDEQAQGGDDPGKLCDVSHVFSSKVSRLRGKARPALCDLHQIAQLHLVGVGRHEYLLVDVGVGVIGKVVPEHGNRHNQWNMPESILLDEVF